MVTYVILYLLGYVDLSLERVQQNLPRIVEKGFGFPMFYDPLCPMKPFCSIEQLNTYSKHVDIPGKGLSKGRYYKMENGYILYTCNPKFTYLSLPWLGLEDFLKANGYRESKKLPSSIQISKEWFTGFNLLRNQMMLQYWAAAFEKCSKAAAERQIRSVEIQEDIVFHDITFHDYSFEEKTTLSFTVSSQITCKGMIQAYPICNGMKNVGTFIYCDTFLVVCDEYGRTFLFQQVSEEKSLIPIVNQLIEAGYTINPTPDEYVIIREN